MKHFLITLILFSYCSIILAQETEEPKKPEKKFQRGFSIFGGGAMGSFASSSEKFAKIYPDKIISPAYVVGIGDGVIYVIAKYRSFVSRGKSEVNFDIKGKAEWSQKFYTFGARLMSKDFPLYAELAYLASEVEEKITTDTDPVITELTTEGKTRTEGISAAFGIILNFPAPIRIFGEAEYSSILKFGSNPSGRVIPQIGGIYLSAGLLLVL